MLIWSGLGFLPVIFFIAIGFAFTSGNGGDISDSTLAYILMLTGIATAVLGWWLHKRPARTVIDKETGEEMVLRRSHSLFFIPLTYCGPIILVLGVVLRFSGLK